ncbi:MAG TPA: energy transducer TonB [Polyangiales bacterium]|nr:energy transducer TonB [Polyangiales bacterium]
MARRKRKVSRIYLISLLAHLLVGGALALIPKEKLREVVAIALNEAPPPKDPPPPPPPRPAPPPTERPTRAARSPRTAASDTPQPTAASAAAVSNFANIGLTLDSSSSDGLAVPIAAKIVAPAPKPAPVVIKPKVLVAKREEPTACTESVIKARPLSLIRPTYTDDARRARVEGRVRIELAVDDQGVVTNARVLDGLGHGLDEAALAAARALRFSPATLCKRAVAAPFVIAMRFQLGS